MQMSRQSSNISTPAKCRAVNPRDRAHPCQGKMLAVNQILTQVFLVTNFARFSVLTLYGIVSPRRVWCEHSQS